MVQRTKTYSRNDYKLTKYELDAVKELNRNRKIIGMPPIQVKERQCLHCRKKFVSAGARLCKVCTFRFKHDPLPSISGHDINTDGL